MELTVEEPLEFNQCREAVKRLNDFLDHELSSAEANKVQKHLRHCQGCFAKFHFEETLLATIRERIETVCAPPKLRTKIIGLLDAAESDLTDATERDA